MKVAIVHDWLTGMRGGERVLETFLRLYPQADVFTLIHVKGKTSKLIDERVKGTSFLQKLPLVHKFYRALLPIFPQAIRSIKLDGYDLIISLSHASAKNIIVKEGQRHICFCFTPMRYIWDQAESYLGFWRYLAFPLISYLRAWDKRGSQGVSQFVAISKFVAARIRCFYGRRAKVIYPSISDFWFESSLQDLQTLPREEFYLYAGALVPYKKVDFLVNAFNHSGRKLKIAGVGPEMDKLKSLSESNIEFLGRPSDVELRQLYSKAKALVFSATEDFGLIPIEALACGCPVIAHFSGALRETLQGFKPWDPQHLQELSLAQPSREFPGIYFQSFKRDSLISSLSVFEAQPELFSPKACRQQAEDFREESFVREWQRIQATAFSEK